MLTLLLSLVSAASAVSLEEAWASAEANSVDLALIHEQRVQSDALRTQALSLLSPKLVFGADYTINEREVALDFSASIPEEFQQFFEGSEPIVVNKKQYLSWNASIVQPIFSGQAIPLYKGAVDTVKAGRATEESQRDQLRVGIAQMWWGLALAREGEAVAQEAVANAKKHLAIATTGVEVGSAAPTVKLQAELGVARAEREAAVARTSRVSVEESFARVTGLPKDSSVEVPLPRTLPYGSVEAAVERALSNRPDLRAARYQARAGQLQATASHLAWLPSIDGRFTEAYTENSGFSGEPYNWQLVFSANWVLWDGGARIAEQVKGSSIKRMSALYVEGLEAQAAEKVHVLWNEYARARLAVDAVAREVELARENLRLAEVAFEAGSISYLEVEDARLGEAAARMSQRSEQMNLDLSAIQLLAATGDL